MKKIIIPTLAIIFFAQLCYSQSSTILFSGDKKTKIYINEQLIGTFEDADQRVAYDLDEGDYQIKIQDKKRNEYTETVKIDSNFIYVYDTRILIQNHSKESPLTGIIETKNMDDEVYFIVEVMPQFNGGEPAVEFRKFIAANLQYPEEAYLNDIQGRVIVQFAINSKGYVEDVVIMRSVDKSLDEEAIRVVKSSPQWTPGVQRGRPVKVLFTFPINFVLTKKLFGKE